MTTPGRDLPFETRTQAHAALAALMGDQGTCLSCFSADFRAWPLDQAAFIRQLEQWALRDTRRPDAMRFLALDWRQMSERFPRFAAFRRDFAHQVSCRQISDSGARGLVEMAWSPHVAVYAYTATWMSGEAVQTASRLHALRMRFDEVWEQAAPACPAVILGL
ncbi:MAG: hypothetical protein RBR52_06775 [Thiomonas sp.]|uniref:hypothetical protein n=1 Tax=Thiomonas sp. TaxID=2047785 RepID=UPI002A35DF5B|nr:hypothetical protein [Thiomonas sp.]MDY0330182.1 hypothetical protein [Thiomonas sp.]